MKFFPGMSNSYRMTTKLQSLVQRMRLTSTIAVNEMNAGLVIGQSHSNLRPSPCCSADTIAADELNEGWE